MNHLAHLISALEPPWVHLVARCLEEALPTSRVSSAVLPPGSSGTKTEPCLGLFLTNCHKSCMFFLTFVTAVFYTFATIRYYSDRGTSVVRTLRPNLVASSLLIPNFSLADQVLEIFCTSSSISFLWPRALMFANRSIRLLDLLSGVLFLGHQVKFIVSESFENFQPFSAFPAVTVSWICSLVPRGFPFILNL